MKKQDRYSDKQIKQMLNNGYNSNQIRKLKVSPKRITRISNGIEGKPPGAQPKFNETHFRFVVETVLTNPSLRSSQIRELFFNKFKITISAGKISEILRNNKFYYGHPIKVQKLKDYQIIERYNFCLENLDSEDTFFETIVFTDECKFQNGPDSQMIYRQRGNYSEQFYAEFEKFPVSVMAWGAIGINFKPDLYFYDGPVNSESYLNMLKQTFFFENAQEAFKSCKFFFEQDGAKMHSKNEVLDFIFQRCNLVCGWPANSPDLSPIEMMWSIIKFRIANYPNNLKPKNKAELIEAIQNEWRSIEMTTVNNLVLSFKSRLQICARVGGKTIVPFLKNHFYQHPEDIPEEEPSYVFDELTDIKLLQYANRSWKSTGQALNLNPNLVKYRTNFLQHKSLNESTMKILLSEQRRNIHPQLYVPMPQIFGYSDIPGDEEEMDQAAELFPIITYYHDDSDDSDSSESE